MIHHFDGALLQLETGGKYRTSLGRGHEASSCPFRPYLQLSHRWQES